MDITPLLHYIANQLQPQVGAGEFYDMTILESIIANSTGLRQEEEVDIEELEGCTGGMNLYRDTLSRDRQARREIGRRLFDSIRNAGLLSVFPVLLGRMKRFYAYSDHDSERFVDVKIFSHKMDEVTPSQLTIDSSTIHNICRLYNAESQKR